MTVFETTEEARQTVSGESFYAIRLTDGELIYGDYGWVHADGPDDWTVAEESDHDEATEYEIVRMVVEPVAKRTFGDPRDNHVHEGDECSYCGETWPCEYMAGDTCDQRGEQ